MLTFREFIHICEGKKTPPGAVKGTYQQKDGVKTYTLAPYEGPSGPLKSEKKVMKTLENQGGIGGGAIKKAKKKVEKIKKIKEDITQLRRNLNSIAQQDAPAERLAARRADAAERMKTMASNYTEKQKAIMQAQRERHDQIRQDYEERQQELKAKQQAEKERKEAERQQRQQERSQEDQQEDLQLEQHPPGQEQNPYNVAIAKQQAARKKTRETHAQQEMGASARSQQRSHNAVLRAIMSRRTVG